MRHAIAIREEALGKDHVAVGTLRNNLGVTLMSAERYRDAQAEFDEALAVLDRVLSRTDPFPSEVMNNLAIAYSKQLQFEAAFEWSKRALSRRVEAYGRNAPEIAPFVQNTYAFAIKVGDTDAAEAALLHMVDIDEAHLGHTAEFVTSLDRFAEYLRQIGREETAAAIEERARALRASLADASDT